MSETHSCDKSKKRGCECKKKSHDKWKYSLYSALVFLLVANPYTYILINKLLGGFVKISSVNGCPTSYGLVIHSLVFALIIRLMMDWKI